MSLKIRLTRLGDKGNAFYRMVVAENTSSRDGKFIDIVGTYDPKVDGKDGIKLDKKKALGWVAKGATPTDTAKAVLVKAGILESDYKAPKKAVTPKAPAPKKAKK